MKLTNPDEGKKFDRVAGEYGYRKEGTRDEEIVHIPTGRSNQAYYQPEMVMNPEGCDHDFVLTSIGMREVECSRCHYGITFHAGINYTEREGTSYITLHGTEFPVRL